MQRAPCHTYTMDVISFPEDEKSRVRVKHAVSAPVVQIMFIFFKTDRPSINILLAMASHQLPKRQCNWGQSAAWLQSEMDVGK